MLGTKDIPLAFRQRTTPALTTDKMHGIQTGQEGYKQKDCQALPRQGKMVFEIFPGSENCLSVNLGLGQSWLLQHCK